MTLSAKMIWSAPAGDWNLYDRCARRTSPARHVSRISSLSPEMPPDRARTGLSSCQFSAPAPAVPQEKCGRPSSSHSAPKERQIAPRVRESSPRALSPSSTSMTLACKSASSDHVWISIRPSQNCLDHMAAGAPGQPAASASWPRRAANVPAPPPSLERGCWQPEPVDRPMARPQGHRDDRAREQHEHRHPGARAPDRLP